MILLIVGIPVVASTQYQPLQLAALDAFGVAPTATPFASTRAEEGQALYLQGDIEGAEAFYAMAVQQQPDNVDYLYEYGKILVELDRTAEAETLGRRIMLLAPNDPRGYALAANALMWSDPARAIPLATAGIELGIPFAPLNGALAIAYTQLSRVQEALQRGDLAIRQDPMDASVRRAYSYPLTYVGRYNEAIEQLEEAIAINPNITAPYFELASLYRRINQDEMAVAIYDRLIEMNPNEERAFLRKCETYAAVGLFQEGEPFCETALEIDPQYADAYRMQGQLRYARRNYEGAIESFNTCIALGSDRIECYYLRGLAHYFLDQCDDAWTILNDSLQRAEEVQIQDAIKIGLGNITVNCDGYRGLALPTAIPPTPIPPTPIGGI
jgi:tetratricopeptide (TPR) repeat protein